MRKTVACETRECANRGIEIVLPEWSGARVRCGVCKTIIEPEAEWHVPPTPEELGIEPAPQRAADLIANMTEQERTELAALIAPPKPPTLGQEKHQ